MNSLLQGRKTRQRPRRGGFQTRPWDGGWSWFGPGRFQTCPYIIQLNTTTIHQYHDTVNMVRHHDKCIAFNTGIMIWQLVPYRLNEATAVVQPHFPVYNFPEQTRTILRYDRDEIRARLPIIVFGQTNRTAIVFVRIVLHGCNYLAAMFWVCNRVRPKVGAGFKPALPRFAFSRE